MFKDNVTLIVLISALYHLFPLILRLWEKWLNMYVFHTSGLSNFRPLLTLDFAYPFGTSRLWKVQHYSCRPCPVLSRACGTTRREGHCCWTERQWFHGRVGTQRLSEPFDWTQCAGLNIFLKSANSSKNDTKSVICVCRDVDDPEYKPAPALLKDEMEVRTIQGKFVNLIKGI